MTRERDEAVNPKPHHGWSSTAAVLFAVCAAPTIWLVQLICAFSFAAAPCFWMGERSLHRHQPQLTPLMISVLCLFVALAGIATGLALLRRTRREADGPERRQFETGQGRTRFLATWGVAFSAVFATLIAIDVGSLLGFASCVF